MTSPSGNRAVLLAVFAHPDDETFLAGPLLAHLVARGVEVQLICATPEDGPPGSVAGVRRRELACAASVLGIGALHPLGYSEAQLWRATVAELTGRVRDIAASVRPDALLTDAAYGAYGHAHHILLHRAAVAAGAVLALGGQAVPVYALAYPLGLVVPYFTMLGRLGLLSRLTGGREDLDLPRIVAGQRPADLRLRVEDSIAMRRRAGACHRSQLASAPLPLRALEAAPLWVHAALWGTARLTRILPGTGDPPWLRERSGGGPAPEVSAR